MYGELGRWLIWLGLVIAAVGLGLVLFGPLVSRLGLGRLPGDIYTEVGGVRVFFPLATMILLSLVLTVLLNLFLWLMARR